MIAVGNTQPHTMWTQFLLGIVTVTCCCDFVSAFCFLMAETRAAVISCPPFALYHGGDRKGHTNFGDNLSLNLSNKISCSTKNSPPVVVVVVVNVVVVGRSNHIKPLRPSLAKPIPVVAALVKVKYPYRACRVFI